MNEEDIKKANIKLSIFDSFPYIRLREVCDKICELGFDCEFIDNGNIVFTDTKFAVDKETEVKK